MSWTIFSARLCVVTMSSSTCTSTRSRLTTSLTIATLALTSYYIYRRITTRRTKGPAHLISQQYLPCEYRRLNITVALCDDIDDPHLRQQLWDVCQLYFAFCTKKPIWNDTIVPTSFIITQVDGGITNRLYHCSYGTRSILIRIYGPRTELVIDRARENAVVDYLSQKGWSGKVYGRFLNGRLEQWFDGYHAVKPSDMAYPPLQPLIACELAHMHQLDPASGTYIPLDQDPHIAKPQPISTLLPRSITIWRTLFKWLDRARDITFDDPIKQKQLSELNLDWWSSELHSYHTLMQSSPIFADTNTSVLVFAHNDLLSGNVLYHAQQKRVRFIDFEYGAYNPRGFDIANHWLECCGFGCDWAQFPTPTQQASFARTYLATIHHVDESSISESDVDALINEVHGWLLADHFFWGLWGIVQAKYSPIAFDYLSYSLLRHKGYRMMRSQSWKCVQQTIPK